MSMKDLLRQIKPPCAKCPYKLGLVKTLIICCICLYTKSPPKGGLFSCNHTKRRDKCNVNIYERGNGTINFELTDEEEHAVSVAKLIVKRRARDENGDYDEQMLEWCLYGLLRERGIGGMIGWAKSAPFRKKTVIRVGYSY